MAYIDDSGAPAWFTEALAAPVATGATTVDGVDIAFRAWGSGSGRGIVLVHGGGAHSRWWDHIGPLLALNRVVVALDLSGHGDSGRRPSYGLDSWKNEIIGVAAAAGLVQPPIVIGHSMGGFLSLHAASAFGAKVAGVITIDSPVLDIAPEERAARAGMAFGPLRVFASRDEALKRFHPVPDQPVLPYVGEHVAQCSVRAVDGGWSWKFDPNVFRNQHMPPALRALHGRLCQFRAEYGILGDQPTTVLVDGSGRRAEVIEIPGAGHHIMLDQPVALITGLRAVLTEWDL